MRDVRFCVLSERPGHLEAEADVPSMRRIAASTLEELQHEAREALINYYGSAHVAYRVRIDPITSQPTNAGHPMRRQRASCR